ncbi:MAG: thioredoxin domain-containing protein [Candidatus Pacebacteria bacterium]|nr:thioredoxin domain-containing protein [Candidatus Paceibacterota bacterium]
MKKLAESKYLIPSSIVVAGFLIAVSIYIAQPKGEITDSGFGNNLSATVNNINEVNEDDHVRGNRDAKVSIVEFSDFECPFCSRLHPTISQIVDEYDGEVNWVYRHFPLTSIHSRALGTSIASECVAEFGGNDAFRTLTDRVFENQRELGVELFYEILDELSISRNAFNACAEAEDVVMGIQADFENAREIGARGTPFVVVINEKGETFPFSGALSYEQIRLIVEEALAS